MRITEKIENGFYELTKGNEFYGWEDGIRLVQIVGQLEDIEDRVGINLIALLNAKSIHIAKFSYWRWDFRDKQQCKKDDIGAIEEKEIEEKRNFCIDLINKEIVIIEYKFVDDDFDCGIRITKLKFDEYGKTWAFTKEELE